MLKLHGDGTCRGSHAGEGELDCAAATWCNKETAAGHASWVMRPRLARGKPGTMVRIGRILRACAA